MIRVLLADDDALVRGGLRALLGAEDDIDVVGEAADGRRRSPAPGSCSPTWSSWTSACPGSTG